MKPKNPELVRIWDQIEQEGLNPEIMADWATLEAKFQDETRQEVKIVSHNDATRFSQLVVEAQEEGFRPRWETFHVAGFGIPEKLGFQAVLIFTLCLVRDVR